MPFDYDLDFGQTDFRRHPELYRIGIGEQGVLLVEPYKSEILPFWHFKTEAIATESSEIIYKMFYDYLEKGDFVGADMARKFLQMGFTRARRYANHKSGKKYSTKTTDDDKANLTTTKVYPYSSGSKNKGNEILTQAEDALTNEKARCAEIFRKKWFAAKDNPVYQELAQNHRDKYGK